MLRFFETIREKLMATDYDEMYKKIEEDKSYCPEILVDNIFMTIYLLEHKDVTDDKMFHKLSYYMNILQDKEVKNTLSLYQVLYIVYFLNLCRERLNHNSDLSSLYM